MNASCPGDEALAAFAEGSLAEGEREGLARHLRDCGDCCGLLAALSRADALQASRARRPLWAPLAAAAVLLLMLTAGWRWGRSGKIPSGSGSASLPPAGRFLAVSAACREPGEIGLMPGSRLILLEGAVRRLADAGGGPRLDMAEGSLRIEHLAGGPLELVTPAGRVSAAPGAGPLVARVDCRAAARLAAAFWVRSAEASTPASLSVTVEEGELRVLPATGGEALAVQAGERLSLPEGGQARRERVQPPGAKVWKGEALAELLGARAGLLSGGPGGGAWALPIPASSSYVLQIRVRAASPESRLGLAMPVKAGIRLWQPSGSDRSLEGTHYLVFAALGPAASGAVDGRRVWAVGDAASALQPVGAPAGLRVWGTLEVLEIRLRVLDGVLGAR